MNTYFSLVLSSMTGNKKRGHRTQHGPRPAPVVVNPHAVDNTLDEASDIGSVDGARDLSTSFPREGSVCFDSREGSGGFDSSRHDGDQVTFLHKDIFRKPIRLDWAGQFTKKTMKHMLLGRMSCLWVQRHKEAPMLIANIHQAGSATPELQQQVWMALQGVRAQYPEAQGVLGGDSTQMHQVIERDIRQIMQVI